MRRKDREIPEKEAWTILEQAEYGILSIATLDGKPYGIPLNYCTIDNSIYFHCAIEGQKVDIIKQNNAISFCAVGKTKVLPDKFGMKYESAIISGSAQEVIGSEKQNALECMLKKYSKAYFNKGLEMINADINRTKVYKIIIHSITGKARK